MPGWFLQNSNSPDINEAAIISERIQDDEAHKKALLLAIGLCALYILIQVYHIVKTLSHRMVKRQVA